MKCTPNPNHWSPSRRSSVAGTSIMRERSDVRPVAKQMPLGSQAAKPPAHWPGTSIAPTTDSSLPTRLSRSTDPSSSTHQVSAACPSRHSS